MYKEHDGVVLLADIEDSRVFAHGRGKIDLIDGRRCVAKGTHGAIVDLPTQTYFLVELFDSSGETIGLAEMSASEVRPATPSDYPARVSSDS